MNLSQLWLMAMMCKSINDIYDVRLSIMDSNINLTDYYMITKFVNEKEQSILNEHERMITDVAIS